MRDRTTDLQCSVMLQRSKLPCDCVKGRKALCVHAEERWQIHRDSLFIVVSSRVACISTIISDSHKK